jgi:16S rRNA (cytosine967-C5)-methyltransferase
MGEGDYATVSPARKAAFDILRLVEGGGYASELLRSRTAGLKRSDAGLASEIVFGVLRVRAQLDFLIEHFSGRAAERLDREVRLALRIGIYQLRRLDRVPRHAAVTESVEMVKLARKRSAAGLVNAVLRKVHREPVAWPDRLRELSHPAWLLESWERQFGAADATGIARAFLLQPETYIRVPASGRAEAEALDIEETDIPGCFRLVAGEAGGFRRQDIGSQAVARLLAPEPGQRFLDLCAAPGNKTVQVLETGVRAVACDISFDRILPLAGLEASLAVLDGTRTLPFRGHFDRVLVDAPCSGTGTMGRNPEIKWRIQPLDLAAHHARQVKLVASAISVLAPGGRLVYATCSLEHEENEEVVEEVLKNAPSRVRLEHTFRRIPGRDPGGGFFAAVITSE